MDLMLYINLMLGLIVFIAVVYAIDVIISVRGELNDLKKQ